MRRFHPLRDHLWLSETLHNYGRRWGRGVVKMTASVRLGDDVLLSEQVRGVSIGPSLTGSPVSLDDLRLHGERLYQ